MTLFRLAVRFHLAMLQLQAWLFESIPEEPEPMEEHSDVDFDPYPQLTSQGGYYSRRDQYAAERYDAEVAELRQRDREEQARIESEEGE